VVYINDVYYCIIYVTEYFSFYLKKLMALIFDFCYLYSEYYIFDNPQVFCFLITLNMFSKNNGYVLRKIFLPYLLFPLSIYLLRVVCESSHKKPIVTFIFCVIGFEKLKFCIDLIISM
jgi:hypothetical protein